MNSQPTIISLSLLLAALLLLLSGEGCTRSVPPPRVACGTCEEPNRFVRVQRHTLDSTGEGSSGFDHPFPLNQQDWHSILKAIQVQRVGTKFFLIPLAQESVEPAFTAEEVDYLSATLPRAFTQAERNDWVVFSLGRPQENNLTKVTTGAWYVEGPLLYFILANYDAGVSMSMIRDELNRDPLHDIAGAPRFRLNPGDHVKNVTMHRSWLSYFQTQPPTIAIDYKRLLNAPVNPLISKSRVRNDQVH